MAFILRKDFSDSERDDLTIFNARWNSYRKYLKQLKTRVPDSAYEFADSEWHYKTADHRCPHDAWLESIEFNE
jgi:hypothetical protein